MIRDTTFFGFLEYIASNIEYGRSIAIRTGASMRCDDYGAFGLAFKSAVDPRGSFQRVQRYGKIVTSVANYTVEPGSGSAFMPLHPNEETRLGLTMTNELAMGSKSPMRCWMRETDSATRGSRNFSMPTSTGNWPGAQAMPGRRNVYAFTSRRHPAKVCRGSLTLQCGWG